MKKFSSVDEILDFAMEREEESFRFYTDLANKMERAAMSMVFEQFAREEIGHKNKLLAMKKGKLLMSSKKKVTDLKIGDYLVDVEPDSQMDYQHALIFAMKKEKAAFKLYNDLADLTDDDSLRNMFLELAQEEAKHKLRFEIEYDEQILTDN